MKTNDIRDIFLIDKDKDVFLDCIEKVKAASGCNDIILVTDAETLKNIDRLYGYKVVHMDKFINMKILNG